MSGENSSNESCYDLQEVPKPALAVHALVISVIIMATVAGNGLILLLVAKFKVLRTRSVLAKLSLTCADILWCLCFHVPALVSATATGWVFGEFGCSAFGLLSVQFLLTRWLVLAVVCIDRFSTVRFPFSYTKYSKPMLVVLTVSAWILPFLLAFFPAVTSLSRGEFRANIPTCLYRCEDSDAGCRFYYGIVVSSSFVIGSVVPTVLYVWLYKRARSLRPAAVVLGQLALQPATGIVTGHTLLSTNPDKWSRDIHGYLTFILILVTFVVTSLPAYLSQIFRSANFESWCRIPIYVHFVIQLVFLSSTALDPLVIMRDRDFWRCFKRMFCCWKSVNPFTEELYLHTTNTRRQSVVALMSPMSNSSNDGGLLVTSGDSIHAPTQLNTETTHNQAIS